MENETFECANYTIFNALHVLAELLKARENDPNCQKAREMAAASIIRLNALTGELSMHYGLPAHGSSVNRVLAPLATSAGWL